MRSSKLLLFILLSSSLIVFATSSSSSISASTAVLAVNSVEWTTDVEPGDIDAVLIISVSNLSNLTLSAITGTLMMNYPFTDSLDYDMNATAQGIASSTYINVSEYKVFSGEPFSLQFSININPNAGIGTFGATLEISYHFINSTGEWERDTSVFPVNLIIPNREPGIIAFYPSSPFVTVNVNETLELSVQASDPDNQTLTYQWTLDNMKISTGSNYTFLATENNLGYHTLEVMVRDPLNMTAVTTWTINVVREAKTTLNVESHYIFAGYNSVVKFNLSNTVWKGTADITVNVPEGIIIRGESSWKQTGLAPGDIISLNTTVYAPLQFLGQTGGFSLTIDYTDYLGNDVVENVVQGVIIRGKVDIVVYDLVIQYNPSNQKITFNGNLLNKGTVSAMFVNVSLHRSPDLLLTLESASYIGELEKNDPLPFTLGAYLIRDPVVDGEIISNIVTISWVDDLQEEFYSNVSVSLTIKIPTTTTRAPGSSGFDLIIGGGFTLAVVAAAALGFFYIRKKK